MRHAWVAGLLALAVAASCTRARHDYADIVFRGGPVYTVDSAKPHATAVTGTRIVFVGDDSGAAMFVGPRTRVIELKGRMLLPAFHDSHVHPVTAGLRLSECALDELTTPAQIADSIARCAKAHPSDAWFLGHGWQLPVFPHANPGRALLDRLIPDRPAYVGAADGHSAWVNSRALALAHVTARTPDPPDGRIERDAAGNPSGTLREGATDLVEKFLPSVTAEQRVDGLARAIRYANSLGIVALQEASADSEILVAYQTLDRRDSLNARVVVSIYVDPAAGVSQLPRMIRLRDQFAGNRDRATGAKIFADGVIESHTSAHLEMIDTLDLPRFKSLGAFANFQALWAFRDSYIRELTEPVLGPERSSRLYP
ncbi:MAG TPA: amidohydrolase family protein, partial [Gemmatimonadaceae bacterium]